ncbi:hypothetical protein DQ04_00171000 [Trypanosoma grayi]|uniref:hypothetical protein n=1 Tax=Trypanosoma grayi TaxID=71804 RepID=UPI0004F3F83D|nr:hypothetical protein DQ04_00171000 [Trypanosoma grayi]KEG15136.1 hypothetical protein DQ04_00171000 [Trypanosoma grayi]
MMAKGEGLEAKLDTLQSKLEAMHADIKKLGNSTVSFDTAGPSASRPASLHATLSGSLAGQVSAIPIGRGSRLNVASPLAETTTPNGLSASFLPVIVGNGTPVRATLPEAETSEPQNSLNNRRKAEATRQKMQEFVKPMRLSPDTREIQALRNVPCAWLLSIALSCSYVSGEQITIEDILRHNRLGLHYVSFPSVTLAELFDITSEFLSSHTKLRQMGVHCEVANFDTETVDEVGDVMGMGERLPIMTLSQFRKELSNSDGHSIYIVNYDPYTVEQHELRMQLNYMETYEQDAPAEVSAPQWTPKNQGAFALILSFNSALHLVSFGVPCLLEDGRIRIQEHTVPIQIIYRALCVKDGYCNRSRGFVRVFISDQFIENVPSIFPLNVLDGSISGGPLTTALDTSIAPHILGLSLMHHLVTSTLLDKATQRRQSINDPCDANLRGIPVTKLCQQLGLGIATIVGGSNKVSVSVAFSWYRIFLRGLGIEDAVALGVVLVTRRSGAEDGPVNITDDVFLQHLELAMETKSVILIGFDVNIALNVKVDNRAEPCHFAIVIGLDQERGIVRLVDVNVKKYRKTWHVPVTRLYSAVIGYGYIMAAKSQKIIGRLDAKAYEESILSEARYSLPPTQRLLRFEYPKKNYVVTVLADAFDRLGFSGDVENVMNFSGFHLSFMLSEHLPLENAATVARNYSHNYAKDRVSVLTNHMERGTVYSTTQGFLSLIRYALEKPRERCLIFNFQASMIHANKAVWNGGNGGSYAILLGFDETNSIVTLSDANHESFYRTWVCPFDVLLGAVSAMDSIALRSRGTLLLTTVSQHDLYVDCYDYEMSHALVHHPFKPSVWPASHCLALIASEMGSVLSAPNRAVRYSAEDFLYNMPDFSVHKVLTGSLESEHIAAIANTTFKQLQIALEATVVDHTAEGSFLAACHDEVVNGMPVTMTLLGYDAQLVHGVAGFSVGVINRVRNKQRGGTVQLVEGNGCTFGSIWERPATELQHAVRAMVRIKRAAKRNDNS